MNTTPDTDTVSATRRRVPIDPSDPAVIARISLWSRRLLMAAAAWIPLTILRMVLGDDPFQYLDYFEMVGQTRDVTGAIRWGGFFEHQNEHLVVIPKMVIQFNILLFDGSRTTLGVFVVCVAAALGAVIWRTIVATLPLSPWGRVAAVWVVTAYVFPLAAQHNFRLSISGTAWILANLLMVSSVALAARRRSLAAGALGVLATFTYGTGLAVWPALLVVLVLRRRVTWRDGAMMASGVVAVLIERATDSAVRTRFPLETDPFTVTRYLSILFGQLFADTTDLALIVGAVAIGCAVIAVARLRDRALDPGTVTLVAVTVVPLVAGILMAMSRGGLGAEAFEASRLMSIASLFALCATLLVVAAFGDTTTVRIVAVAAAAVSCASGVAATNRIDDQNDRLRVDGVAAYMGIGDGIVDFYEYASGVLPVIGHYPFDGSYDDDCGLFGTSIDPGTVRSGEPAGAVEHLVRSRNPRGLRIRGWVVPPAPVKCVLVVDADDVVVGFAIDGYLRPDLQGGVGLSVIYDGWDGFALNDGAMPYRVVALLEDSGELIAIGDAPAVGTRGD